MNTDLFGHTPNLKPKINLEKFCQKILGKSTTLQASPEELAQAFADYFSLRHPITFGYQKLLAQKLGIHNFAVIEMPTALGGMNTKVGDEYQIFINKLDAQIRQEHTVFHEIYELMVKYFATVRTSFRKPTGPALEGLANRFSAAIFMPEENFLKDALESGLDILQLQKKYRRSYSSALIHTGSVLARIKIPFWGLIYEDHVFDNIKEVASSNPVDVYGKIPLEMQLSHKIQKISFALKHNCVFSSMLPLKGDMVRDETLAILPFKFQKAVFIEKVTGFDFFHLDDCSLLIRPVEWCGGVFSKIIISGVNYSMRHLFEKQLNSIDYHRISHIHRLAVESIEPTEESAPTDKIEHMESVK